METDKKIIAQKAKVQAKRQYIKDLDAEKMALLETGKYEAGDMEVREAVWSILDKIDYAERSLRRLIKNALKMVLPEEEFNEYHQFVAGLDIIALTKEYDFNFKHL